MPTAEAIHFATPANPAAGPLLWAISTPPMHLNIDAQVNDPAAWNGPKGLAVKAYAGWDANNLYLSFNAVDDVVLAGEKQPDWGHDGIELFYDTRKRSKRDIAYGPGCYQMLVAVPKVDGAAPTASGRFGDIDASKVVATCRRTDTGYAIDVALPWAQLKVKPHAGYDLGFDFAVNDRDSEDKNRYKALWRGWGDDFNNLGDLGTVTLAE